MLFRSRLRIRIAGEVLWVNLDSLAGLLGPSPTGNDFIELPPDNARLDVTDANGNRRGDLVVFDVQGHAEPGASPQITTMQGLLLLDTAPRPAR